MASERASRGDFERSLVEGVDLASDTRLELIGSLDTRESIIAMAALLTDLETFSSPQHRMEVTADLIAIVREEIRQAEVLYVGDEMCELLEWIADDFEPEVLYESDLLVSDGVVVFSKPQTFVSDTGRTAEYDVLTWSVHEEDEPLKTGGRVTVSRGSGVPDGYRRGVALNAFVMHEGRRLPCFTGGAVVDEALPEDWRETRSQAFVEVRRTFQVLMRLCAQRLVVDGRVDPSRPARRRAKRESVPESSRGVRVVTLRKESRPVAADHEPQEVNWSHRWVVKPHWRNQWYPSLGVHRQILVGPYVKGPDTLPLKLPKERGFALVR